MAILFVPRVGGFSRPAWSIILTGSNAITGWSYGCGAEEEFLVSGNEFYSAPPSHQSNLSAKKKSRLATLSVPCLNGSDRRTLGLLLVVWRLVHNLGGSDDHRVVHDESASPPHPLPSKPFSTSTPSPNVILEVPNLTFLLKIVPILRI